MIVKTGKPMEIEKKIQPKVIYTRQKTNGNLSMHAKI
jgi:hypothetical protein